MLISTEIEGCRKVYFGQGNLNDTHAQDWMPSVVPPFANAPQAPSLVGRVQADGLRKNVLKALKTASVLIAYFLQGIRQEICAMTITNSCTLSQMQSFNMQDQNAISIDREGKNYVWGSCRMDLSFPVKMYEAHQTRLNCGYRLAANMSMEDTETILLHWLHPQLVRDRLIKRNFYFSNIDELIETLTSPQKRVFDFLMDYYAIYLSDALYCFEILMVDKLKDYEDEIDIDDAVHDTFCIDQLKRSKLLKTAVWKALHMCIDQSPTSFTTEALKIWFSKEVADIMDS